MTVWGREALGFWSGDGTSRRTGRRGCSQSRPGRRERTINHAPEEQARCSKQAARRTSKACHVMQPRPAILDWAERRRGAEAARSVTFAAVGVNRRCEWSALFTPARCSTGRGVKSRDRPSGVRGPLLRRLQGAKARLNHAPEDVRCSKQAHARGKRTSQRRRTRQREEQARAHSNSRGVGRVT